MMKYLKYMRGLFIGGACAALPVVLSRILIRNLAGLFSRMGALLSLDGEILSQGTQILSQLRSAVIVSPWLPYLLAGAALGALTAAIADRRRIRHAAVFLVPGLLLLLPSVLLALWFTSINAIGVGSLLQAVLPILAKLL